MRFPLSRRTVKKTLEAFTCVLFYAAPRNSDDVPMERYDFARLIVTISSGHGRGLRKRSLVISSRANAPVKRNDAADG